MNYFIGKNENRDSQNITLAELYKRGKISTSSKISYSPNKGAFVGTDFIEGFEECGTLADWARDDSHFFSLVGNEYN